MKTLFSALKNWLQAHGRALSLFGGIFIVTLWTCIRHITNGVNFDVVGQLGVAKQWTDGIHTGAELGATNYLLKIPIYIVLNSFRFISPMNRILIAAILFNVITFILLYFIYEQVLRLYKIKLRSTLYLSMAWLATIIGGVYWADYANSRNLETAGGIFFLYLILKYIHDKRYRTLVLIASFGSVLFFADSLQLYVCGIGASLFLVVRFILRRSLEGLIDAALLFAATVAGFIGSRILHYTSSLLLPVTYLIAPKDKFEFTLSNIRLSLSAIIKNTFGIFDADIFKHPYNLNSIRQFLNAAVLLTVIAIISSAYRKKQNRKVYLLGFIVIAVNYLVYTASGQVLKWETSRYLVMVPLITILLLVISSDQLTGKFYSKLKQAWLVVIIISGIGLLGGLAISWPNRHSKDTRVFSIINYMDDVNFKYALSSRDVGITSSYLSDGRIVVLPMACEGNHTLRPTNLFYDNAAFSSFETYNGEMPIILDSDEIRFGGNTCSYTDIVAQFGSPKREQNIPGAGLAMIYDASTLRIVNSNQHKNKTVMHKLTNYYDPVFSVDAITVKDVSLTRLQGCHKGTNEVIVAHPDDDLLFINPTLSDKLSNSCVRTIFITAGDDGRPADYWQDRERGIEAAYAAMLGVDNNWASKSAVLHGHTIAERTLVQRPSVGIVFLRCPDGNTNGSGFETTGFQSLEKLSKDSTATLTTVDSVSRYTYSDLVKLITTIISADKPNLIMTHVSNGQLSIGDHSDHRATGTIALLARAKSNIKSKADLYVGYTNNSLQPNLSMDAGARKKEIFITYALEDKAVCNAVGICSIDSTYGNYFLRSYHID